MFDIRPIVETDSGDINAAPSRETHLFAGEGSILKLQA
jgi:hypothetical protein